MNTHEARAFYSELLDGELAPAEHAAWQQRLEDDAELAQDFARFVGGVAALRSLAPAPLAETRVAQLLAPFEGGPAAAGDPRRAWVTALSVAAALLLGLAWTWRGVSGGGHANELVGSPTPSGPAMQHEAPAELVAAELPGALPDTSGFAQTTHLEQPARTPETSASDPWAAAAPPLPESLAIAPAGEPTEPRLWPAEETRAPRPRASSEMHLVKHAEHTALSLHGDVASIVPQLIELLDDSDPELVELAEGRLALLRDNLGANGQLPPHLARPIDVLGREPTSTLGEDWRAWWHDARPHLPATPPGGVL